MCGITGIFDLTRSSNDSWLRSRVAAMTERLRHRGPDGEGTWVDAENGIAFGHRRLSILDLSPAGSQPMKSAGGRFILSYNGEIYNHPELRAELEAVGYPFRGNSDTETLLAALERWGVEATLGRINGMFAFALWDRTHNRLTLVRDRLGIKPLYFARIRDWLVFGSELKSITAFPEFSRSVDRAALALLLQHNYVPAPRTIYSDVSKLPPGHLLEMTPDAVECRPRPYWSLLEVVRQAAERRSEIPLDAAVDGLETLLTDAVQRRLVADVSVGAFLSGGIDSTSVVALAQARSAKPIRTFSLGFEDPKFDESAYAAAVASHLGTDHSTLTVTDAEAREVIPQLSTLYDEPFADSSQIPTCLVAKLARGEVTVVLSGDGGDELFGGYNRYRLTTRIWNNLRRVPYVARRPAGSLLRQLGRRGQLPRKLATAACLLDARSLPELYSRLHVHWNDPSQVVRGGEVKWTLADAVAGTDFSNCSPTETLMCIDSLTYLPDDILVKVDRATMGVGLEARVPLLDHRLVEFAWGLTPDLKMGAGQPKRVLRNLATRYVPSQLLDRPKIGFGVPIGDWLRGPLRDWAEDLLAERRLAEEGYFRASPVRSKWQRHLSGKEDWHYYLWDILMFQSWLRDR